MELTMSIPNLKGKRVLITGAGSGIGRATVMAFARRGAHIIASDINLRPLESLKQEVEALGTSCQIYAVDVSNEAAMRAFAATVQHEGGAPDVLINNAGISHLGLFLESDMTHWSRVINVNLMGVVYGCRYFLPQMLDAGGPRRVLNVASTAGIYPAPSMGAYSASKHAVMGLTEVLKMELADTQVGFTTVFPGVINTPLAANWSGVSPTVTAAQLAKTSAYYRAKGCAPEVVAEAMVRAVQRGQDICLTGPGAALVYHVKRMSLGLIRKLMVVNARKIGYLKPYASNIQ
jgi:NAD(P)-dependent dehydrogenase (short-subunit alcohol dehydrogenase family)